MANYQEARVRLTNTESKKLKSAAKKKRGAILGRNKKNFEGKELPDQLSVTTKQTTKIRNAFAKHLSIDVRWSKAQIYRIIQSGGSFCSWSANLGKISITNVSIHLATNNLPRLVSNLTLSAIKKLDRKISVKGTVRVGKGFTLFISNEDINAIMKIIKSLEDSGALTDGVAERVKNEIKKTRRWIFWKWS